MLASVPSESEYIYYFKHYMKTEDTGIHNTLYLGVSRKLVTSKAILKACKQRLLTLLTSYPLTYFLEKQT